MKSERRIARNAPCPCGSGKRFKHCHGAPVSPFPAGITEKEARQALARHEAGEILRKREQGHGRPIISFTVADKRIIAVGDRVVVATKSRFFHEFLLENFKDLMGRQWAADASRLLPDHPLIRWFRQLTTIRREAGPGTPLPMVGVVSALLRLSYALYLIEHNDKPSKSLVKRLQRPLEFAPACYEALVESAFAVAGATIVGAEDGKDSGKKPEFFATFEDGRRYAVEAKRRQSWNAAFNVDNKDFADEITGWIRGKIHAASKKRLVNPVYWFELGIGASLTQRDVDRLGVIVGDAIMQAETVTVSGEPAQPAYVFVTNNSDFSDDDATAAFFCLFQGFRMEDFRQQEVDIETAMNWHDKHRPIRRVFECLQEVQRVPITFDGTPAELLDSSGAPLRLPQLGDHLEFDHKDGSKSSGLITEATAVGKELYLVVGNSIVKGPLTEQEAQAAKKHGNAVFGKPEGPNHPTSDPLEFYDRMMEIFSQYPDEYLLRQLGNRDEYRQLGRRELVARTAREVTKLMMSQPNTKKA